MGKSNAKKQMEANQILADDARIETQAMKQQYADMEFSNPFLNQTNFMSGLENTMDNLTVNQQQAQFEAQQMQQNQANILGSLRGAAGGSGIAALAQSLAQQGQIGAQRASASIGQQESRNQAMAAQEASRLQSVEAQANMSLQGQERQGEVGLQNMELQRVENLLGMQQMAQAGYQDATMNWAGQTGKGWQLAGKFVEGVGQGVGSGSDRKLKKNIKLIGGSPSGLKIYAFEYIDKALFGSGTWQGVMSDEVPQSAVLKHKDGYDMVDYSKLDVEFKKII